MGPPNDVRVRGEISECRNGLIDEDVNVSDTLVGIVDTTAGTIEALDTTLLHDTTLITASIFTECTAQCINTTGDKLMPRNN